MRDRRLWFDLDERPCGAGACGYPVNVFVVARYELRPRLAHR